MADNGAYNPNYEGQSVRAIMGRFEPNGKFYSETTAISQLQRAHDNKISDIYNAYRSSRENMEVVEKVRAECVAEFAAQLTELEGIYGDG